MDGEKTAVPEISRYEFDWQANRITSLEKKIRLLVRILVDKKIIGTELAKSVEETFIKSDSDEILKWFIAQLK